MENEMATYEIGKSNNAAAPVALVRRHEWKGRTYSAVVGQYRDATGAKAAMRRRIKAGR